MSTAWTRAASNVHEARTRTDATLTALGVESFRRATGRLPATLDELVPGELPGLPADPMMPGGTLLYRVDADRVFTIYSRGADGDDDGGAGPVPPEAPTPAANEPRRSVRDFVARYGSGEHRRDPIDADWVLFPPRPD